VKKIALFIGLAVWALALAGPASAQIYTGRDSNGVLILSDRPLGPGIQTVAVSRSSTLRVASSLKASPNGSYDSLIVQHAQRHGIRVELVRAVIQVESGFNAQAVSPKGAMGLMQLMPATASRFGVLDPFNPAENIRAGVGYLRQLLNRYKENETLALAAYNAGPGAVDRYGSQVPPYRETQNYVRRIKAATPVEQAAGSIYKSVEIVNGRAVPRYSDSKPSAGEYEVIAVRR
jgi:soluble lytic murein transglycosylase-like protein